MDVYAILDMIRLHVVDFLASLSVFISIFHSRGQMASAKIMKHYCAKPSARCTNYNCMLQV